MASAPDDISNAFLHGHLSEQVYCQQPTWFVDAEHPDRVCLLSRSLYGLKQSPRTWYQRMAVFLHQLGFRSMRSDASLFVYRQGFDVVYLLLYVYDIILTAYIDALPRQLIVFVLSLLSRTSDRFITSSALKWYVEQTDSSFINASTLMSFLSAPECLYVIIRLLLSTRRPSSPQPMDHWLRIRLFIAPSLVPCNT
jgi:hypothetical protein